MNVGRIKFDSRSGSLKVLIDVLILIGIIVMVSNIVRYAMFVHTTHDVLSSGSKRDRAWKALAFVLLVFFLCGYIFIVVDGDDTFWRQLICSDSSYAYVQSS